MDYQKLLKYAVTAVQAERIKACIKHGDQKKAAKALKTSPQAVNKSIMAVKKRAIESGYDPDMNRHLDNPAEHVVSGYSTLVRYPEDDPYGRVLEWVKTNRSIADQLETAHKVLNAMAAELPKAEPIPFMGERTHPEDFTVLPLGDPHIGLMTWGQEVGEDWDLSIAGRVYDKVFQRMFKRMPKTKEIILVNTGDFFHADNIAGETARSGHKLDMDGRYGKWIEAGVCITRLLIDYALANYEKVTFVNVTGNHDDILGQFLGIATAHIYDSEPRLEVMRGENPFQYIERGNTLLGFAHGHTCKLTSLPGKMADDMAPAWGRTTYRHWITGHVHHRSWQQFKEHPGCSVETVGIIPPKDAYAHGGGYGARRGLQAIMYNPNIGETMRIQEYVLGTD